MSSIADIRTQYSQKVLVEDAVLPDAIQQFEQWWKEALEAAITEVNAMTLATVNAEGLPDARIVLLKGLSPEGFTFFTNFESSKGRQLAQHPQACLVFFWKELERQVRVRGAVTKVPDAESAAYFYSRPEGSQVGAIVSPQSRIIESRQQLEDQVKGLQAAVASGKALERPAFWGGFRLSPTSVEFWQGRPNRLHDRLLYTLRPEGGWKISRLAP
ncbi:pyridoxamine 5'-phosphate oxidase [Niabella terrae]